MKSLDSSKLKFVRSRGLIFCAAAFWLLIFASGCASVMQGGPGISTRAEGVEKQRSGWWYAYFHINWPGDKEPSWSTDLLIAHRVVAPVLARYDGKIPLWRFHRRAARDQAGHRFSFIFYCPADTARKIFASLDSSAVLDEMKSAGMVVKVAFDDTKKNLRPQVEDTSDRNWSGPLQKSWPYFIMGVSRTWLDLIEQLANDGRPKPLMLGEMEAFYRGLDESVREAWMKEGSHAFLHHLNAVFEYAPVTINGKVQVRF